MSSSTFVDTAEDKDDQLIIIVNADGTITVDPETLQKLIANQHGGNLSVVRVGDNLTPDDSQEDGESDGGGPHVNLTVEGFYPEPVEAEVLQPDGVDAVSEVVDPFSQMEPEHIARLESVLQSEQAKEILGTNLVEDNNLNTMLDILEGKDEVSPSVVHNDHSYTTAVPAYQQPQTQIQNQQPVQVQQQPSLHRPLTRGGRTRGRGRGLMTRGGRGNAVVHQVVVPVSSSVISQSPTKVVQTSQQKAFVVTQTSHPRVIAQTIAAEEEQPSKVIQRRAILTKVPQPLPQIKQQTLHQSLLPSTPPISVSQDVGGTPTVITSTPLVVQRKVSITRGGRGRGRGGGRGRRGNATPGDEVSAALQAMELSPPQSQPALSPIITSPPKTQPSSQPRPQTESETTVKKKLPMPTVIIRKIGPKSEIVSSGGKGSKVRYHTDDSSPEQYAIIQPQQQSQGTTKAMKQVLIPKNAEPTTPNRVTPKELASSEDSLLRKKKEKKAVLASSPVESLGPELFSTPDIIRRVSTDKPGDAPQTPTQVEPKVQVQPTHPPFKPIINCDEMTPESLLDSIHAEVAAKDDSRLIAEALLLDDLTNDDSQSMSYPGKEKPETANPSIHAPSQPQQQTSQSQHQNLKTLEAQMPRIRKLPPIELPTTRSATKKAAASQHSPSAQQQHQSRNSNAHKEKRNAAGSISEKRYSTETKKSTEREKKVPVKEDFVSDFEDEEAETDEESWNSEDDPDRLWCICKKPHNNRFMICCDGCEEWFHGKCVGITKTLGQQMESQGIEWSCPNCEQAKAQNNKKLPETTKPATTTPSTKLPPGQQTISSLECIVCKKPAKVDSNYCSDLCVRKHALNMLALLKKETEGLQLSSRVVVYEKKSGKLLAGNAAPTVQILADWLLEHQTYEIAKPSVLPPNKFYKRPAQLQTQSPQDVQQRQPSPSKQTQQQPKQQQTQAKQAQAKPQLKQQLLPQAKQLQQPPLQAKQPQQLQPPQAKQPQQLSSQLKQQQQQTTQVKQQQQQTTQVKQQQQQTPQVKQQQQQAPQVKQQQQQAPQVKQQQQQAPQVKQQQQQAPQVKQQQQPLQVQTKQQQQPVKQQVQPLKQSVNKQGGNEKGGNLKQTVLTQKITSSGAKEIGYALKPTAPHKIQIIQAQPLTSQQPTNKVKLKDEEEAKSKKSVVKITAQSPSETTNKQRLSLDGKKSATDKASLKEEKRRDSVSSSKDKEEKKKEEKKKRKDSTSETIKPPEETTTPVPATQSVEPVRANVKRTLQELLNQRVKQDNSIDISNEEVIELVASVEEELFSLFKDTGTKYKSKYRSLVFNIKDPKNLTLYKKIVEKSISPAQLVKLSPEELASQELAQWREKEAKHQLEIIKKNELDLIHQAKTVVLKSRKGEEVIETKAINISELESALNRTADDYEHEKIIVPEIKEEEKSPEKKSDKKKGEHSSRQGDRKRKKEERSRRDRSRSRRRSRSRSRDRDKRRKEKDNEKHKEKERDKRDDKAEETIKEIEEVISQHISIPPPPTSQPDSDLSDREPSSTVNISTPPLEEEKPHVWRGILNMSEVTKLYTSAYEVSGSCEDLGEELSEQLDCVGRIQPDSVWEYVSRMKKAGTKDIIVIRFHSEAEEEKMNYLSLYSYLNSRNRMAVIGQVSKTVKDFYVLPLANHSPIPQVLLPLDGPGFDDYRPHLLLGIIIRTKKGSASSSSLALSTRNKKPSTHVSSSSNRLERSYTPPLPADGGTPPTTPPPLPPFSKPYSHPPGLTPPLLDDDEPYSPGEDDLYSPEDNQAEAILVNPEIQRNLEEVNRMIEQKRQQIKSIAQAAAGTQVPVVIDEETPYSPSSSFTPPRKGPEAIPFLDTNEIKLPPNLQDILASIKGTPTMDVKSDPIVKAYTSQAFYEEEEEDLKEEEKDVKSERASRDPRQRPDPPKPKSALSQLSDSELIRKAAEMESEEKKEFKQPSYYYAPPPSVAVVPPPIYPPPPPTHYKYPSVPAPPPPPPVVDKDRKRKDKFKERRPPQSLPHSQRRKWNGGHHNRGMVSHRPPMRGNRHSRFRGGFDRGRGGFRGGGGFRPSRGGGGPQRFRGNHGRGDRNVQSEWDEEIRNFEQRKARERKRRASRSPSPRRRSLSPPRRRSRRASSNNS